MRVDFLRVQCPRAGTHRRRPARSRCRHTARLLFHHPPSIILPGRLHARVPRGRASGGIHCRYGDVLRGIGAVAGQTQESDCVGRVAAMVVHGVRDSVVSFAGGQRSRDTYLATNGCENQSVSDAVAPCIDYPGCAEGLPVAWCEHNEGDLSKHQPWLALVREPSHRSVPVRARTQAVVPRARGPDVLRGVRPWAPRDARHPELRVNARFARRRESRATSSVGASPRRGRATPSRLEAARDRRCARAHR